MNKHVINALNIVVALLLLLSSNANSETIAPDFELQGRDSMVKLSDYRGKAIYLDFWASWCGPCISSFPWMEQMYKKYKAQGLVVIAINLDQDRKLADDFLKKYPSTFIVGFDQKGDTPEAYQVQGMPSAMLIDTKGNIVSRHIGFKRDQKQQYEKAITELLSISH